MEMEWTRDGLELDKRSFVVDLVWVNQIKPLINSVNNLLPGKLRFGDLRKKRPRFKSLFFTICPKLVTLKAEPLA